MDLASVEKAQPLGAMEKKSSEIFAHDYVEEPYWWMAAPPPDEAELSSLAVGVKADVIIIGSGITGVVAALYLARGGADVIVIDSNRIGSGAARMNAGFLGRTLKRSFAWLEGHMGSEYATNVYRELDEALHLVEMLTASEGINCYRQTCGRIISANSEAHLKLQIEELAYMKHKLGFDYEVLERADLQSELASEAYCGGVLIPDLGSLHPGLYHSGLLSKAKEAGVRFFGLTTAMTINSEHSWKTVHTDKGAILAKQVVIATNGYTARRFKWHARRLIPFRGFVVTTDVLPSGFIDEILPRRRTYLDTKMNIDFIRPAPDSERIIFGGMTGRLNSTSTSLVPALYERMVEIMPKLKVAKISRSWSGFCAGTFDFMPHIGSHDGIHYALGYNFAGVPVGSLFGRKLAARILGGSGQDSSFDVEKFPTMPFFNGTGLVAPLAMKFFDYHDKWLARKG